MRYVRFAALAPFLMIFLSGCARSIEAISPLPPLPVSLAAPCRMPAVKRDAVRSLVDHRLALAECRRRHGRTVRFYRRLRANKKKR